MKWLLIAYLAGQALDHSSTAMALHRGCQESNPLVPSRIGPSIAVGITIGGGSAWVFSRAHDKHPKLVNTMLALGAGIRTGAGIYNLRQLGDCRRARFDPPVVVSGRQLLLPLQLRVLEQRGRRVDPALRLEQVTSPNPA